MSTYNPLALRPRRISTAVQRDYTVVCAISISAFVDRIIVDKIRGIVFVPASQDFDIPRIIEGVTDALEDIVLLNEPTSERALLWILNVCLRIPGYFQDFQLQCGDTTILLQQLQKYLERCKEGPKTFVTEEDLQKEWKLTNEKTTTTTTGCSTPPAPPASPTECSALPSD